MKNKFALLILSLALTGCAINDNNITPSKYDHSGRWKDNYFTYFDDSLLQRNINHISLDKTANKVFTSYNDENFISLEKDQAKLNYYKDYVDEANDSFSQNKKLSQFNEGYKQGFISKLFDGKMFCYGRFEAVRIQINEKGISYKLPTSIKSSDYLYLNFKYSLDFKSQVVPVHNADITVNITLFGKENNQYSYLINNVTANDSDAYIFFGFNLKGIDLSDVTDIAISYKLEKDQYLIDNELNLDHALLLYEFGFANPTF